MMENSSYISFVVPGSTSRPQAIRCMAMISWTTYYTIAAITGLNSIIFVS